MAQNDLLIEPTLNCPDWRLIDLQQRVIASCVADAQDIGDITQNRLL
jgi:hypothetical protein